MHVVIADDAVLLRAGIARLLEDDGCEVVAQAGDADDLLRKARAHRPDVCVVDIRMPPGHGDDGLVAARTLRAERPDLGVLVLSQYVEEHYATELLRDGADGVGYLLKDRVAEVGRFTDAVRQVAAGGCVLDPQVAAAVVGRVRAEQPVDTLTPRELEVLGLMAEGRANRAIAEQLVVSERAVERHVGSIFTKLELPHTGAEHRRVLAVLAHLERAG